MTFSDWVTEWLPQLAHVSWGAFIVLAFRLHHAPFWWSVLPVLTFAALKEAIFDPLTETPALRGSGWEDFGFWCLGVALGIVASL